MSKAHLEVLCCCSTLCVHRVEGGAAELIPDPKYTKLSAMFSITAPQGCCGTRA